MADEKPEEERADADAGTKLDKILAGLDSMSGRMDALERRMDADEEEGRKDRARRDAAEEKPEEEGRDDKAKGKRKDADEPPPVEEEDKPVAADLKKKRKDAEHGEDCGCADCEGKRADARKDADDKSHDESEAAAARADAAQARADLNEMRERMRVLERAMPKQRTDADFHEIAEAQSRFDSVYQALGIGPAPMPMSGEDTESYKLRINTKLKAYSPAWKDVNLYSIAGDAAALAICDRQIFEAATEAAQKPVDLEPGELREIKNRDATGRIISTFVGRGSFVTGLKGRARRVAGIRNDSARV